MGRRRSPITQRRVLSRRAFLRGAGAASALVVAQPFVSAARGEEISETAPQASAGVAAAPFLHGVASGDPLADRVILWTRVTDPSQPAEVPVGYVVALDPALSQVVASGNATALAIRDYTVKVDVAGLVAGTTYYYRFSTAAGSSPIGRTRTLPVGSVDRLRIAVVSCASLAQGFFNAYRHVARRADLDLVVHVGDYIYEHGDGEYGSVRSYRPPTETISLRDYRTRHNQYKGDPDLQELHRQHPVVAVWDDHEIADNAWVGGAANHQLGEGSYASRVNAAVRAYHEWMPIRNSVPDQKRIHRSFRLGNLVELFMLEERLTGRNAPLDPNVSDDPPLFTQEGAFIDPARRMIDRTQFSWLLNGMRASNAQWKLLGQGVMLAPVRVGKDFDGQDLYFNPDQWDGYQPARHQLLRAIGGNANIPAVRNVVVLTGDLHTSWGADLPMDPYGSGYDPETGSGSRAVEFVGTSITSPGTADLHGYGAAALRSLNPHLKYVDLTQRGYLLLDINNDRCSGEWWYVDTVLSRADVHAFGTALKTLRDTNHLIAGSRSSPRANAPPLAP